MKQTVYIETTVFRKGCVDSGYLYPEICTPQELMGETDDE